MTTLAHPARANIKTTVNRRIIFPLHLRPALDAKLDVGGWLGYKVGSPNNQKTTSALYPTAIPALHVHDFNI